jgi:predicted nucleic acid-binding protein
MRLDEVLRDVALIGIDTAPFIYFVERDPTYIERMRVIFRAVDAGRPRAVTSVITLTEVLSVPIEKQDARYEREYREMLLNSSNITSLAIGVAIAEHAARLRAKYRLRTPDALQVATAIEAGADAFLTNDAGIQRVSEARVLVLDALELDDTPQGT